MGHPFSCSIFAEYPVHYVQYLPQQSDVIDSVQKEVDEDPVVLR